ARRENRRLLQRLRDRGDSEAVGAGHIADHHIDIVSYLSERGHILAGTPRLVDIGSLDRHTVDAAGSIDAVDGELRRVHTRTTHNSAGPGGKRDYGNFECIRLASLRQGQGWHDGEDRKST